MSRRTCQTCRWFNGCDDQADTICAGYIPALNAVTACIDTATTDRLTAWAKAHLATLSPERRAELERGQ